MWSVKEEVSEPDPLASGKRCIASRLVGRGSRQVRLPLEDVPVVVVETLHVVQDRMSHRSMMVLDLLSVGRSVRMRKHPCALAGATWRLKHRQQ